MKRCSTQSCVGSLRASHRFPFQAKPSFLKEGLGGLSISMRRIRSRNDKKKDSPKRLSIVFRSSQSPPLKRRVWVDCLYQCGESARETTKKDSPKGCLSFLERKTRVCPSAPHSVYQAITFAQYYTPNSRDTWVVSRCRFRVRLLPYKLQNYSCLRQIYE